MHLAEACSSGRIAERLHLIYRVGGLVSLQQRVWHVSPIA